MDPSDLLLLTAGEAIFRIVIVLEALYNQVQKDLVANLTLLARMASMAYLPIVGAYQTDIPSGYTLHKRSRLTALVPQR